MSLTGGDSGDSGVTCLTIPTGQHKELKYLNSYNSYVTSLVLHGRVTSEYIRPIMNHIWLKELVIQNFITDVDSLKIIVGLILSKSRLCELKLVDGQFKDQRVRCVNYLVARLVKNPSVTKLTYIKTQSSQDDSLNEMYNIYKILYTNTTIKSLHIETRDTVLARIEPVLSNFLEINKTVHTLHLDFVYYSASINSAKYIFNLLNTNTVIKNLTLFSNDLSYRSLTTLINKNTTLRKLDIARPIQYMRSGFIGEWLPNEYRNPLVAAIAHNTTLISLNIPYKIPDEINRMRTINMWKLNLFDICLAFATLKLPPYVILEIFDWLTYMDQVPHVLKIRLIQKLRTLFDSIRK